MVESLKKVLAWKGLQYGINANGTTSLTSAGGSTSRYSKGTRVTVNTILGHKDTNATVCPGRYLYSQLPTIRRDVAKRINDTSDDLPENVVSISAGVKYHNKTPITLQSEPSTNSTSLQHLPRGAAVITTHFGTSNGWWQVKINNNTGWVQSRDLIHHNHYRI